MVYTHTHARTTRSKILLINIKVSVFHAALILVNCFKTFWKMVALLFSKED